MKKVKKYQNGSTGLFDAGSSVRSGIDNGLLGLSFVPGVGYAANLASSGLDLYDAYNAKTPEARNEALVSAGIGLIPGGRIARGLMRATKATKTLAKVAPKMANNMDPSYVNKLVNNKTIKEFRTPSQISDAAQSAASNTKGTFTSLFNKAKGALSGNSMQPSFKKGTKNINSNNMKMKKYDGGTQGAQPSRYQKLDAKLGGILPGGVTRAQAKAAKATKNASPTGSFGPMAGGYATAANPPAGKSFGPLSGNYMPANIDLNKPVGPMTNINQYTNPKNMPSSKTAGTAVPAAKGKVNFKKPAGKKPLGGGYKMYEDMNIDQQRQYREGMASGKDFTVTVADKYGKNKQLKYSAATKGGAELSKKRNAEYDKRYQDDLIKKMPDTKNIKDHDHLLRWQDKALDNAKAQFDARHKNKVNPTPTPKPKEDEDDGGNGMLWGLGGALGAGALYAGAKRILKKKFPKVSAAAEVVEEAVPVIKRNAQKLLPAAQNATSNLQKKAQEAFDLLNIKRIGEGTKVSARPGTSATRNTEQAVKGETKLLEKGVRLKDVMPDNSSKFNIKTKETKLLPPASEKPAAKTGRKKKGK
jgi:hypothetical protein